VSAVEVDSVVVRYRPLADGTPTLRRIVAAAPHRREEVVALDGVSFTVERGEAFGVIGRNGAGKSTLMRVLARTLRPDSGTVRISGETSTLLQLGVGFNPQLSGRKNVYLGALAMGMTRGDVDSHYDEIVAFAELEHAIDRPLKTFSSGMTARLAFSISMYMRASVFLVDEVLAVGDDHFKKKSMEAMRQMLEDAGTIVFVSHALGQVRSICDRVMWLENGRIKEIGPAGDVIDAYKASEE
jgi:ABC-type polysaccharide/polyol phosphate transport system ATPase subunit